VGIKDISRWVENNIDNYRTLVEKMILGLSYQFSIVSIRKRVLFCKVKENKQLRGVAHLVRRTSNSTG
jgi:hypothetical protein